MLLTVKFVSVSVFCLREYFRAVKLRESPDLKDHPPCEDIPVTGVQPAVAPGLGHDVRRTMTMYVKQRHTSLKTILNTGIYKSGPRSGGSVSSMVSEKRTDCMILTLKRWEIFSPLLNESAIASPWC